MKTSCRPHPPSPPRACTRAHGRGVCWALLGLGGHTCRIRTRFSSPSPGLCEAAHSEQGTPAAAWPHHAADATGLKASAAEGGPRGAAGRHRRENHGADPRTLEQTYALVRRSLFLLGSTCACQLAYPALRQQRSWPWTRPPPGDTEQTAPFCEPHADWSLACTFCREPRTSQDRAREPGIW